MSSGCLACRARQRQLQLAGLHIDVEDMISDLAGRVLVCRGQTVCRELDREGAR